MSFSTNSLLSINVGRPRLVQRNGRTISTAIFKQPVDEPVEVTELGIVGDEQADKSVHGGPDKAIYAYSEANYAWWRDRLQGRDLQAGEFGENLTVSSMTDDEVCVGDIYGIGEGKQGIRVQVTQPRTPCMKLGVKMNMPAFVKQFHQAARTGFYLRVLETGEIRAGDSIVLLSRTEPCMSISSVYELMFSREASAEKIHSAMQLEGLSETWRKDFAERLTKQQTQQ